MVHGLAVNPHNGNIYIGDREEYRIVVYDGRGTFVRTIQMRNLVCGLYVDPHNQLWMATGQDGQIFKIDWDGNILGAIGNGPGSGSGTPSGGGAGMSDSGTGGNARPALLECTRLHIGRLAVFSHHRPELRAFRVAPITPGGRSDRHQLTAIAQE